MSNIPVSYFTDFNAMSEGVRRCFWREMALHGAKHLVLVSSMITSIMTAPALKKQLENEMDEAGLDFCDAHAPYGPLWDMSCTAEDERSAMKLKQKIALETGGAYAQAVASGLELDAIYTKRIANMDTKELDSSKKKRYEHRFQWPLCAAFFCFFLQSVVKDGQKKTAREGEAA